MVERGQQQCKSCRRSSTSQTITVLKLAKRLGGETMKSDFKRPLIGLLGVAAILISPPSFAKKPLSKPSSYPIQYSANSVAVVPDNAANAACRKYTLGGIELSTKRPASAGTVTGGGETAGYTLTNGNSLSFSNASIPIDFVVVRGRTSPNKALVVHYYAGPGVTADSGIQVLNAAGNPLPIVEFALCATAAETDDTPAIGGIDFDLEIPRCPADPLPRGCPDASDPNSKEIVLINYTRLRDSANFPASQLNDEPIDVRTCFCTGGEPSVAEIENLVQCDDSLPAFDASAADPPLTKDKEPGGTCTVKPAPGAKVEAMTQLENDPYICFTRNGRRTCYEY